MGLDEWILNKSGNHFCLQFETDVLYPGLEREGERERRRRGEREKKKSLSRFLQGSPLHAVNIIG